MKTIERLESLKALAECGSYTEAAKRLYCSQPTITHHIQQLEAQYQTPLLHRSGKQIRLTEQGEIVLDMAKQMFELLQESEIKVKQSLHRKDHILGVYVSSYISSNYLPGILSNYHRTFPEQLLEIYTLSYDELRRALLDGVTNLAFLPLYPEDAPLYAEFEAVQLFEEELVLVIPPEHPWVKRKVLYVRDLKGETILLPQSRFICQYIEEEMQRQNIKTRMLQMSNFNMIKESVKIGLGIAFLPQAVIQEEIDKGELASVRISSLSILRRNGYVKHKQHPLTTEELSFCREVQSYFHLPK